MEKPGKRFVEDSIKILQCFSHLDTPFQTDIRLDQVVVGMDFPGELEVATQFLFLFRCDPASFEIPLARQITFDVRFRQPAVFFMPDVAPGFDLVEGKRSHPFISHPHET